MHQAKIVPTHHSRHVQPFVKRDCTRLIKPQRQIAAIDKTIQRILSVRHISCQHIYVGSANAEQSVELIFLSSQIITCCKYTHSRHTNKHYLQYRAVQECLNNTRGQKYKCGPGLPNFTASRTTCCSSVTSRATVWLVMHVELRFLFFSEYSCEQKSKHTSECNAAVGLLVKNQPNYYDFTHQRDLL